MNFQNLNDDLAANIERARRALVEIRNGHGGAGAGGEGAWITRWRRRAVADFGWLRLSGLPAWVRER